MQRRLRGATVAEWSETPRVLWSYTTAEVVFDCIRRGGGPVDRGQKLRVVELRELETP